MMYNKESGKYFASSTRTSPSSYESVFNTPRPKSDIFTQAARSPSKSDIFTQAARSPLASRSESQDTEPKKSETKRKGSTSAINVAWIAKSMAKAVNGVSRCVVQGVLYSIYCTRYA